MASWQMAILRKSQIWQEFIGLAKIKTRWQMLLFLTTNMAAETSSANQQYWQLAISRNWQIEKMWDWTRIHQRFGKNSNEVTKRGTLTNGDYKKMANLGENGKFRQKWRVQEFGQLQMRRQKGASWQTTIL